MQLTPSTFCPLIKKECRKLDCSWFTKIAGTHPQTGQQIEEWACAVALLPMLLLENAKETRSTGASVDLLRRDVSEAREPQLPKVIESLAAPLQIERRE